MLQRPIGLKCGDSWTLGWEQYHTNWKFLKKAIEDMKGCVGNKITNKVPIIFIKPNLKVIRPRGFPSTKFPHNIFNFNCRKRGWESLVGIQVNRSNRDVIKIMIVSSDRVEKILEIATEKLSQLLINGGPLTWFILQRRNVVFVRSYSGPSVENGGVTITTIQPRYMRPLVQVFF